MPLDTSPASAAVPDEASQRLTVECSDIGAEILSSFGAMEAEFLATGDRLGSASDILTRLTATFEALPVTLESAAVTEATEHLEDIAREASHMAETLTQERVALERLSELSKDVSARVDRLRRTVGAISVLSINARIAATQVNARGEDFSVYTAEIGRLANAAKQTIECFGAEHEQLAGVLNAARTNTMEFERKHKPTLLSVANSLEDALLSVTSHRAQSDAAAMEIGSRSRRIAEGIATVIMALQIGDITRQRVEHVAHALEVLAGGLKADGQDADVWCASMPAQERDAAVAVVCRLQAAQLEQASNDFALETGRTSSTLSGLAAEAAAIVRMGANLYGSESRRGGSFLTALAKELRQADALIRQTQEARQEVDQIAAAITGALDELVNQVSAVTRIEKDMRLVGLNTTLRCGRLGDEGRTLSVIAQELRSYANQTVNDAQAVMESLRAVVVAAAPLSAGDSVHGADRIAELERETAASTATLEEAGASLSNALALLESEGERTAQLLCVQSNARDAVIERMLSGQGRLESIASALPATEIALSLAKDGVLSLLKGHYTMASERALHTMLDAPVVPTMADLTRPAPTQTSSAPTADLDDIFF